MSVHESLHELVDVLSESDAAQLLDYLNMRADPDELTPDELKDLKRIEAEMLAGDYVTLEDLDQQLGL